MYSINSVVKYALFLSQFSCCMGDRGMQVSVRPFVHVLASTRAGGGGGRGGGGGGGLNPTEYLLQYAINI